MVTSVSMLWCRSSDCVSCSATWTSVLQSAWTVLLDGFDFLAWRGKGKGGGKNKKTGVHPDPLLGALTELLQKFETKSPPQVPRQNASPVCVMLWPQSLTGQMVEGAYWISWSPWSELLRQATWPWKLRIARKRSSMRRTFPKKMLLQKGSQPSRL